MTKRAGLQVTWSAYCRVRTSGLKLLEVDVAGNAVAIRGYGPFGENGSTAPNRFGYTGQQYIAGLGLYYYKARWYFTHHGAVSGDGSDPIDYGYGDGVNWHAYVRNNPVNWRDPRGRNRNDPILLAGLITNPINPAIAGTPGFLGSTQPTQRPDDYKAVLGLPTGAPPTIGQQIINQAGGFVNGEAASVTNLWNIVTRAVGWAN